MGIAGIRNVLVGNKTLYISGVSPFSTEEEYELASDILDYFRRSLGNYLLRWKKVIVSARVIISANH